MKNGKTDNSSNSELDYLNQLMENHSQEHNTEKKRCKELCLE